MLFHNPLQPIPRLLMYSFRRIESTVTPIGWILYSRAVQCLRGRGVKVRKIIEKQPHFFLERHAVTLIDARTRYTESNKGRRLSTTNVSPSLCLAALVEHLFSNLIKSANEFRSPS